MTTKAHTQAQAAEIARYLNQCISSGHMPDGDKRRVDADETVMLALALEQFRAKVYEAEYPELKARMILPTASDVAPGVESFGWEERADVGSVKRISDDGYADDPPTSDLVARKRTAEIIELGGSVHLTLADMRRAAFTGRPISTWKMDAMRRNAERAVDEIAALGVNPANSQYGIANTPVGTGAGQIRNTAMTSASWDATPDAAGMVTDLVGAVTAMIDTSKETQVPNTLILPLLQYTRLYGTFTSDGNPETAAERFLRAQPYVKRIESWDKFKSVDGGGNGSRGLLLNSDPDVVELVMPMEWTVLPPQVQNFAFKILGHLRTAGTLIYRPLGLRYLTALPNT